MSPNTKTSDRPTAISGVPTGATRNSVRVSSSVVIRRPLTTSTLNSTSDDATAKAAIRCSASIQSVKLTRRG